MNAQSQAITPKTRPAEKKVNSEAKLAVNLEVNLEVNSHANIEANSEANTKANPPADTEVDSPRFWNSLYKESQFPWDLGGPTPVFVRLAAEGLLERGRMLVLGAGRGHDARLFARHGFEVTAVDFSVEAVEHMGQLNDLSLPVEIVHADFFSLSKEWDNRFDYILDYTSFCAILPARRAEYADLVARLLKHGGRYVILAFPIGSRPGGPPYTVQPEAIIDLYSKRGFKLHFRETPTDSVPERKGYEQLLILEKSSPIEAG